MHRNARDSEARPSRRPRRTGPRTMVACINCKDRKLKCDDRIPTCANCERIGSVCLVEDPVTKRHQPRNYTESLEARVAFLEGMMQQSRPDIAMDHLTPATLQSWEAHSAPSLFNPPTGNEPFQGLDPAGGEDGSKAINQPNSAGTDQGNEGVGDLTSKVGMLTLNAVGAEPHYLGSSSAFSFSKAISSSLLRGVALPSSRASGKPGPNPEAASSAPLPCALPNYEDAVTLRQSYFQNVHKQYPFLLEQTISVWEEKLLKYPRTLTVHDAVPLFFLYMVYAVGALILPDCAYSPEQLYMGAQQYIDHVLPLDSLESIQALLCCALYSRLSTTGPSVWRLSGLALRQCIELGYHRNTDRVKLMISPLRLEMRRRVFWCVFALDCTCAVTLGRPLGIPYQEVDVEYPADVNDTDITESGIAGPVRQSYHDPPTSISTAIHHFRLRRLWSVIHSTLYSDTTADGPERPDRSLSIEYFCNELENWHASVPPLHPRTNSAFLLFGGEDWFEVHYSFSMLIIRRGQLTEGKGGVPDSVFLECLHASENICRRFRRQFLGKSTSYSWGALHILFLAGLTYLHCLWASAAARQAARQDDISRTCTDCTMVLVAMAERWARVAFYRDLFEALSSRTMTMMVDESRREQTFADSWANLDGMEPLDLSQWMGNAAFPVDSEQTDALLAGLVGNFAPDQMEISDPMWTWDEGQ